MRRCVKCSRTCDSSIWVLRYMVAKLVHIWTLVRKGLRALSFLRWTTWWKWSNSVQIASDTASYSRKNNPEVLMYQKMFLCVQTAAEFLESCQRDVVWRFSGNSWALIEFMRSGSRTYFSVTQDHVPNAFAEFWSRCRLRKRCSKKCS